MAFTYSDPDTGTVGVPLSSVTAYFIDPSSATNGSGTPSSPFNTWASVPLGAGYQYYQKRGTTWTGTLPTLVSGTSSARTVVSAYYNTDGSDNTAYAKPIINIGDTMLPGTLAAPLNYFRVLSVDLRNSRTSIAANTPLLWLGNHVEVSFNNVATNLTALYGEKCSNVKINGNTITCATSVGNVSQNAIVVSGSANMDSVKITGNTINIGEGGMPSSHVVAVQTYGGYTQTNTQIQYNVIRTISNVMTTLAGRAGIACNSLVGGEISNNNVSLFQAGLFINGSTGTWIHNNVFNYNGNFGIQVTTGTSGFKIEWNICRNNGDSSGLMNYYGRGIELSGGSAYNSCTQHLIRFNDCSFNYNWGGPVDNATEGVGIGLDDGSSFCQVYGNTMSQNEGNGLQAYGGSPTPVDTGGHIICGNYFFNNATHCTRNRRSGTAYQTDGCCHVGLSGTLGSTTVIANNLFVGSFGGIHEGSDCLNVMKTNNVFMNQTAYAIAASTTANIAQNIYNPGIPKQIVDLSVDANGVPTPVLLSTGVNADRSLDPGLDANYNTTPTSPLLDKTSRGGIRWGTVPYNYQYLASS